MNTRMTKLPASLMVGGRRVKIRVSDIPGDYGQCSSDGMEITINPDILTKPKLLLETVRHEVLHSALRVSGASYAEHFEEEALVRCLDNIFFPAWEAIHKKLTT